MKYFDGGRYLLLGIFLYLIIPLVVVFWLSRAAQSQEAEEAEAPYTLVVPDGKPTEMGDFGFRHHEFHYWYQTGERDGTALKRPLSPTTSCCDDDCRPVNAKMVDGVWFVYIDRDWSRVPDNVIKNNVIAPNGGAHVCASRRYKGAGVAPPTIYCFIPPGGDANLNHQQHAHKH